MGLHCRARRDNLPDARLRRRHRRRRRLRNLASALLDECAAIAAIKGFPRERGSCERTRATVGRPGSPLMAPCCATSRPAGRGRQCPRRPAPPRREARRPFAPPPRGPAGESLPRTGGLGEDGRRIVLAAPAAGSRRHAHKASSGTISYTIGVLGHEIRRRSVSANSWLDVRSRSSQSGFVNWLKSATDITTSRSYGSSSNSAATDTLSSSGASPVDGQDLLYCRLFRAHREVRPSTVETVLLPELW